MELAQWYQDAQWLTWRGHQVPYKTSGRTGGSPDRPRLLLIHGFPTASWDWYKLWPALAERFSLLAFDMIGFGWADKPIDYNYSLIDQADLSQAIAQQLGWSNCFVLAHDYGDSVAQELLARQAEGRLPFTIDRCVLLNGGIIPGVHRPTLTQKLLMTPIGPLIGSLMSERKLAQILKRIFGPQTQPSSDELAACWQLINHNNGTKVAHKLIRYMAERKTHRNRWVGVLENPPAPLRLIDGMHDPISGAHLVAAYRQLAPQPDVIELNDIGHYPQLEAAGAVSDAVIEFLANE